MQKKQAVLNEWNENMMKALRNQNQKRAVRTTKQPRQASEIRRAKSALASCIALRMLITSKMLNA